MAKAKVGAPPNVRGNYVTIALAEHPWIQIEAKRSTLASSDSGRLEGHKYCPKHESRLKQLWRCEQGDEVVEGRDAVSGYEYEGKVVIVDKNNLGVAGDKRVELVALVPAGAVDPFYFDAHYTLSEKAGHERAFDQLTASLRTLGLFAIGTTVMNKATKVVIVRYSEVLERLVLDTCVYDARIKWGEVRLLNEYQETRPKPSAKQAKDWANLLAAALSDSFDLSGVTDEYKADLEAAVAAAAAGVDLPAKEEVPVAVPAIDLMEALRAEMQLAKKGRARPAKVKAT